MKKQSADRAAMRERSPTSHNPQARIHGMGLTELGAILASATQALTQVMHESLHRFARNPEFVRAVSNLHSKLEAIGLVDAQNEMQAAEKVDLENLKALAVAATPGPWRLHYREDVSSCYANVYAPKWQGAIFGQKSNRRNGATNQRRANLEYAAAANPQAVLVLIEMIENQESKASHNATEARTRGLTR